MKTIHSVVIVLGLASQALSAPVAPSDSIPCVIITDQTMLPVFQDYALWKAKKGINTEVITLDQINAQFTQATAPDRIREYLRTRVANNHTEFVLIGGDVDIIPGYYPSYGFRKIVLSDMYYSCLTGAWNHDGDLLIAEAPRFGDTVDYTQTLAVGRIPCSNATEAVAVIDKIISYETNQSQPGYRTQALVTSSLLVDEGDGMELSQRAAAILPSGFTVQQKYQEYEPSITWAAFNTGPGIMVNNSHAQWHESFLTYFIPGPPNSTTRRSIIRQDIDTLRNTNKYGVFLNFACYNNMLDSAGTVGRSFILNPNGGCAGYVGSTFEEYSLQMEEFHLQILREVFDSSQFSIGAALREAKKTIAPQHAFEWGWTWLLFHATMYLGDPQMEIWTAEPEAMAITCSNTALLGPQTLTYTVSRNGTPVDSALVCLFKEDDVYLIGRTNASGVVSFSDVTFASEGPASVVATKHNYFPVEQTLTVSSSCCVLRTGDANCTGGDEPTMGDLSAIIDFLFISGNPPCCIPEADVDQSGGADPTSEDISIGDTSVLTDYLFITGSSLGLPNCY